MEAVNPSNLMREQVNLDKGWGKDGKPSILTCALVPLLGRSMGRFKNGQLEGCYSNTCYLLSYHLPEARSFVSQGQTVKISSLRSSGPGCPRQHHNSTKCRWSGCHAQHMSRAEIAVLVRALVRALVWGQCLYDWCHGSVCMTCVMVTGLCTRVDNSC